MAVDREGALVIVELKQDWSGYDIYWQAAVYAAAYWKRTADEIIDLYGQYLHGARWRAEEGLKYHTGIDFYGEYQGDEREKAVERLVEHTGSNDVDDLKKKLNHRQRLVLVAHCFYQSTATAVLWLREHQLDVTCLRLIPYLRDEATKFCYVTIEQLIPGPNEEELLVSLRKIPSENDNDVPLQPARALTPRLAFRLLPQDKKPEDLTRTTFAFPDPLDPHDWLVNDPRMLGEDLLVIQRDHSDVEGLSCDILAVDRDGALATVEARLEGDDSTSWTKPIYWRAPLYAATCWKRKAEEIIALYTEYLGGSREAAVEKLKEHTGSEDENDLKAKLNRRQRALLVARTFAKEVTTAALWLRRHEVDVSCLQLTPYLDEETGERYVDRTDLLQERDCEDLLAGLRTTGRVSTEHIAELDEIERQGQQISKFSREIADKVKEHLDPELWHTKTDKSAKKMGDFRYFGLWYPHSSWTSDGFHFFIFVRVAKDEQDVFRVTALFQFGELHARSAGIDEETVGNLRGLTATFAEKPGWNTRSGLWGYYEAGKTVHVALDEPGAEVAAETLAEVIREMYPRIKRVLDKHAPATGGD